MPASPSSDNNFFSLLTNTDGTPSSSPASAPAGDVFVRDASGRLQILRDGRFVVEEPSAAKAPVTGNPAPAAPSPSFSPATMASAPDPLAPQLETLLTQFASLVPQPELRARLSAILRSRLKGIRNASQLRELLARPRAEGGMEFASAQVETVIAAVNTLTGATQGAVTPLVLPAKESPKSFAKLSSPTPVIPRPAPMHTEVSKPSVAASVTKPILLEPVPEPKELPAPVVPIPAPKPPTPVVPASEPKIVPPAPAIPVPPMPPAPVAATPLATAGRLTGPIQELEFMTLEDFRRFGETPLHSVEKVWQKIQLLSADSFTKKVEGTAAWKRSPVNRLYLALGDESMTKKLPIREIIGQHTAAQQPTLTEAEFEAILDLNRRLRT
jgi:hypothetical protein